MAKATECQTNGAVFGFHYQTNGDERTSRITIEIDVPFDLPFADPVHQERLEANLHNAIELALAQYWTAREGIHWHRTLEQKAILKERNKLLGRGKLEGDDYERAKELCRIVDSWPSAMSREDNDAMESVRKAAAMLKGRDAV